MPPESFLTANRASLAGRCDRGGIDRREEGNISKTIHTQPQLHRSSAHQYHGERLCGHFGTAHLHNLAWFSHLEKGEFTGAGACVLVWFVVPSRPRCSFLPCAWCGSVGRWQNFIGQTRKSLLLGDEALHCMSGCVCVYASVFVQGVVVLTKAVIEHTRTVTDGFVFVRAHRHTLARANGRITVKVLIVYEIFSCFLFSKLLIY